MELMELYKRAVAEYLCESSSFLRPAGLTSRKAIPLLVSYSQFAIRSHYVSQGLSAPVEVTDEDEPMEDVERKVGEADEILGALFGLESVRGVCKEVLEIGEMHLVEVSGLRDPGWSGADVACSAESVAVERLASFRDGLAQGESCVRRTMAP